MAVGAIGSGGVSYDSAQALLRQHGARWAREAPDKLAAMERVLRELKKTPPGRKPSPEVQETIARLAVWALLVSLNENRGQLAQARTALRTGDGSARAAVATLEASVELLSRTLSTLGSPTRVGLRAVELSTQKATTALRSLEQSFPPESAGPERKRVVTQSPTLPARKLK